jgi:hypothetical protein
VLGVALAVVLEMLAAMDLQRAIAVKLAAVVAGAQTEGLEMDLVERVERLFRKQRQLP